MTTIERMEGDHGLDAVIDAVNVVDINGAPVVTGTLKIVIGKVMSGDYDTHGTAHKIADMVHQGNGTWRWTPQEGDLIVGLWRLQLVHTDVVIPSNRYGTLLVRPRIPIPEVP